MKLKPCPICGRLIPSNRWDEHREWHNSKVVSMQEREEAAEEFCRRMEDGTSIQEMNDDYIEE